MLITSENQQIIPIDSMKLARQTFLFCRWAMPETTNLHLDLLILIFDQLRRNDKLEIEIPDSWPQPVDFVNFAKETYKIDQTVDKVRLSSLPSKGQQLLSLIELGAKDLQRLWASGSTTAVRSLGYALHPIPMLVRSSKIFDAELFQFNFRIAAFCWTEFSQETQQALCDTVGAKREKVEKALGQKGFAIDFFSSSRNKY